MHQACSQGGSLGVEEPPSQIKGPQFYQKGPLFRLKKPQICQKGRPQICLKVHYFVEKVHNFAKKVQYFVKKVHNFVQKNHPVEVSGYGPVHSYVAGKYWQISKNWRGNIGCKMVRKYW